MKKLNENPIVYLTKVLWKYSPAKWRIGAYLLLFLLADLIRLSGPFIFAYIIKVIGEEGLTAENMGRVLMLVGIYLAQHMGFWIFHGPARLLENTNAFWTRKQYKEYLLNGVLELPLSWHADHHSGDTIDKVEKGSNGLFEFSSKTFLLIEAIISLIVAFFALMYFNIHSGYIVLLTIGLTAYGMSKFDDALDKRFRELFKIDNAVAAKVFDVISNITTVIILRIEKAVSSDIAQKLEKPWPVFFRAKTINETKWWFSGLGSTIVVMLVFGSYLLTTNETSGPALVATLYLLGDYTNKIGSMFFNLSRMYGDVVKWRAAVANSEELVAAFSEREQVEPVAFEDGWMRLQIEGLSFAYEDSDDLQLKDVSMTIGRGQRIALIGESGGGKTTFLKVLRGLYSSEAEVMLDGVLLENGFASIGHAISLIPQDPEIFNATIRDNITMGLEYDDATLRKYSDLAQFTKVAEMLPKQFDSSIFEKGVNLSGGQKQRLAFARGVLASQDKEIVLLDEPASSVDTVNAYNMYTALFEAFSDKTIISSMHTLHMLDLFDVVYVFADGEIAAHGTVDELLESSPLFKHMLESYNSKDSDV